VFDLPRSSWRDYDAKLISKGGGIYGRGEKSIALSPEARALFDVRQTHLTPSELIGCLLRAQCELLWFGGIGAYVKASTESNIDVGDKANDAHRVDGKDVRALVIGEGANLGVTQAGREEYCRRGGRINTDAVDNSAGVDTSDHEVNIKILLAEAERAGALKSSERVPLLAEMTGEVEAHVLRHNYDQTRALTLAQASAAADLDSAERFMERLEKAGKLSRKVEGLPQADEVRALRERKMGLVRPELAKLIAYAKIDAFDAIVASKAPDDPHFEATLVGYFPRQLGRFRDAMMRHRLRREIIATRLADNLVNTGGPTFIDEVRETVRCDTPELWRSRWRARFLASTRCGRASTRWTPRRRPRRRRQCTSKWRARYRERWFTSCAAAAPAAMSARLSPRTGAPSRRRPPRSGRRCRRRSASARKRARNVMSPTALLKISRATSRRSRRSRRRLMSPISPRRAAGRWIWPRRCSGRLGPPSVLTACVRRQADSCWTSIGIGSRCAGPWRSCWRISA
jgi:hypothetical protein